MFKEPTVAPNSPKITTPATPIEKITKDKPKSLWGDSFQLITKSSNSKSLLTDEEKQKIIEEEKLRNSIKNKGANSCSLGCLFFIIIFVILITLIINSSKNNFKNINNQSEIKNWQSVTKFSGNNAKKTDTFIINGEKFKAIYSYKGDGNFIVTANTPSNVFNSCLISNTIGNSSDETICYKKGEYYLDINSFPGNWEIEIQEYK